MNKISETLKYSLVAFNGSNNCDKESTITFYHSYIKRKKELIKKKLFAIENGDANVNKRKLLKDVNYLKEAKVNEEGTMLFLEELKDRFVQPNDNIIEEAGTLISD